MQQLLNKLVHRSANKLVNWGTKNCSQRIVPRYSPRRGFSTRCLHNLISSGICQICSNLHESVDGWYPELHSQEMSGLILSPFPGSSFWWLAVCSPGLYSKQIKKRSWERPGNEAIGTCNVCEWMQKNKQTFAASRELSLEYIAIANVFSSLLTEAFSWHISKLFFNFKLVTENF